jgi:hypothetical protein
MGNRIGRQDLNRPAAIKFSSSSEGALMVTELSEVALTYGLEVAGIPLQPIVSLSKSSSRGKNSPFL